MWAIKGLLAAAICLVMDSAGLNRLCDLIVPVYVVASVITILLFLKEMKKKNSEGEEVDARVYVYKKKENAADLPWKKRFLGRWEKIKREPQEMYEFMVFNGAPSFAASIYKGSDFGQNITSHGEKTENHLTFVASGVPAASSPNFVLVDKEEDAPWLETVDPKGNKIKTKAWWNEAEQCAMCKLDYPSEKAYLLQTRRMLEGDVLLVRMEYFKSDGTSKGVDCTLRRAA